MGKLLHSAKIAKDYQDFLQQVQVSTNAYLGTALTDSDLKSVFKSTTAAHTVLRSFALKKSSKLLNASAGISRRIAILSVLRQINLLRIELRQLIECAMWFVYFRDHPIEEALFVSQPGRLFEDVREDPLSAGAYAGPAFYRAYAKSLMRSEQSKIGSQSVAILATAYAELSSDVHPAHGAVHPSGTLALAADHYDAKTAAKMRDDAKQVLGSTVALVAACDPSLLSRLDAIDREWFDWLVGSDWATLVRGGEFGFQRGA